jgi:hypothetical protein
MSTQGPALPADWSKVLDDVHARLDQAITSANARTEELPASNPASFADERRREIARWNERLDRLSTYRAAAEQVVQSIDDLLFREESRLRQHLATCAALRQKAG